MDTNLDPIQEIHKEMRDGTTVTQLTPQKRDALLDSYYKLGVHQNLASRLADHYGVPYKGLLDLCLSRQLVYLHLMTDYTKHATEADLQGTLRGQQTALDDLISRMTARVSRLDEALRQTEFLRDQAVQVLAMYKTKFLKEAQP